MTLLTSTLITVVTIAVTGFTQLQSRAQMQSELEAKVSNMREALRDKGQSLAQNVALASERAIAVMDFLFLTEVISTTVKANDEIVYGIVMDQGQTALVHSDPAMAGKKLEDEQSARASKVAESTAFELEGRLEIAAPVKIEEKPWGTIRFGMSLEALNREIDATEKLMAEKLRSGIITAVLIALSMIVIGWVLSAVLATRLVQPLSSLADATKRLREGDLSVRVEASGSSEFVELAESYNGMASALKSRDRALRRNMEDLSEALQRAEEAARLKNEFMANISHELRTPLNAIVNVPNILLKEFQEVEVWECGSCNSRFTGEATADDPCPSCGATVLERANVTEFGGNPKEHRHFLKRLLEQAQHLLMVVNDLLDFSKLEAQKMQLNHETLSSHRILNDVVQSLEGLAEHKGLSLSLEDSTDIEFEGDALKLKQVMINLVGNAIKFTDEGGWVTLSTEQNDEFVRFRVRDTGIGIAPDRQASVFESFRQVDGSHTRRHGGTGLGLAIAKQLVELHGGRIDLRSKVGEGTTFFFDIPLEKSEPIPSESTAPSKPPASKDSTVLVVDDSMLHLEIAKKLLEEQGYSTRVLSESTRAIEYASEITPDVIVLDVVMPDIDGFDVLQGLRSDPKMKDIPVVVVSSDERHAKRATELGALWLAKPWDANALASVLAQKESGDRVSGA
ncbi:MAG: ATP-binding protein [Myxococcota bacterium]